MLHYFSCLHGQAGGQMDKKAQLGSHKTATAQVHIYSTCISPAYCCLLCCSPQLPANSYFPQMFYRIFLDCFFITKYNCTILISSKHFNSHTGHSFAEAVYKRKHLEGSARNHASVLRYNRHKGMHFYAFFIWCMLKSNFKPAALSLRCFLFLFH